MRALRSRTGYGRVTGRTGSSANLRYQTLPQNLVLNPGTLTEDFESAAAWTPVSSPAGGAIAEDAVNVKTGTKSLKFTTPNAAGYVYGTKIINITCDGNMQLWVYAHDSTPPSDGVIMVANDAGFAHYFNVWYSASTASVFKLRNCPGWNLINIRTSDWTVGAGTPSWSNPIIRIRIRLHTAATAHSYSVDSLYIGRQTQSAVVLTFDDAVVSQYTEAFSYMGSKRARGSIFPVSTLVGGAGYVSWTQLLAMHSAGWTVGNHTDTTANLTTLTEAQQEAALSTCNAALIANGIGTRQKHVAYPQGGNNADTVTAMVAQSMISGRAIESRNEQATVNDWYHLPGRAIAAATALATATGWIDLAKTRQEVCIIYMHGLSATPAADEWYIDRFRALVDYAIAQGVPLLTMDDLYQLQSGPISIPVAA